MKKLAEKDMIEQITIEKAEELWMKGAIIAYPTVYGNSRSIYTLTLLDHTVNHKTYAFVELNGYSWADGKHYGFKNAVKDKKDTIRVFEDHAEFGRFIINFMNCNIDIKSFLRG